MKGLRYSLLLTVLVLSTLLLSVVASAAPSTVDEWFQEGGAREERKDYVGAIEAYTQAINIKPDFFVLHSRGQAYATTGKLKLALEDLNRAIELRPDIWVGYYTRGGIYCEIGKAELAIADYSKAIDAEPTIDLPYRQRAAVYLYKKDFGLALKDLTQTIKLKPGNSSNYYNRSDVYGRMGQYQKSIDDCKTAIELGENSAYFNMAQAYEFLGNQEEALKSYRATSTATLSGRSKVKVKARLNGDWTSHKIWY